MAETNPNDNVIEEFRANQGRVGGYFTHLKLLLISGAGAKTGRPFTKPLAYTMDAGHYVIVASKGGAPENPAWYYNLKAHPDVTVEVGTEKFQAQAAEATGPERDRLFNQHAAAYPQFNDYQAKTSREIPVFVLARVS
jgi:deazaflavin-dependent oxidoreductase (nitroreductase family)